jgi:LmbE family N-acetylglucosaminyl deacetylase
VIRTQELLAARRIDGAEQFFTRALDFGYSKRADETMEIWGREALPSDVVWTIRTFRPDVIVTRFPTDSTGGPDIIRPPRSWPRRRSAPPPIRPGSSSNSPT